MEIIKKQISLEPFKSRVPALIEGVYSSGENSTNQIDGIWGKIPKNIKHSDFTKELTYEEFIDIYKSLMNVVTNSIYYEYDSSNNGWVKIDFDWRELFGNNVPSISYSSVLPVSYSNTSNNRILYGITDIEGSHVYNYIVKTITNVDNDGIDVIKTMNDIIGRVIIPPFVTCNSCGHVKVGYGINQCEKCGDTNVHKIQESYIPYFMYLVDVNDRIELLEELKIKSTNCCNGRIYEKYGGDAFLNFLKSLKNGTKWNDTTQTWRIYSNSGSTPSVTIPILLTSKLLDIGQYRTYDVDIIDNNNLLNTEIDTVNTITGFTNTIITSGESKLKTLRIKKRSVDDYGNELPGILSKNGDSYSLELPYKTGYFKNININGDELHGDTIASIKLKPYVSLKTEDYWDSFTSNEQNLKYCISGDTSSALNEDVEKLSFSSEVTFGNASNTESYVEGIVNEDFLRKLSSLNVSLINYLNGVYPEKMVVKQEYSYYYKLVYKGNTSGKKIEKKGFVCVGVDTCDAEIEYVLGGKLNLSQDNKTVSLDENSPFEYSDINNWNGDGIWYKETYPMKVLCMDTFTIDGRQLTLLYDELDFESKESTYKFDGIDFPRKKYILCENIVYNTMSYNNNMTKDFVFKDEKMMGINFPLKEKYDVSIDRGMSAAFERHIQLTDVKTWEDLENYRNGMFLNR